MKDKNHNKIFGKNLRRIRVEKKQTQDNLAFESSLDRTYIGLLENGRNSPSLDVIVSLAKALDVEPSRFLDGIT